MTRLRRLAILDAVTYAILIAGLLYRVLFDGPRLAPVLGPIHGVAYLFYAYAVLWAHHEREWAWARTIPLLVTPIIPLAGFYVAERMLDDEPVAS